MKMADFTNSKIEEHLMSVSSAILDCIQNIINMRNLRDREEAEIVIFPTKFDG